MAQSNPTKIYNNYDSINNEAVVDISKYQSTEEKKSSESTEIYEMYELSEIPGSAESFDAIDNAQANNSADSADQYEMIDDSDIIESNDNAAGVRHSENLQDAEGSAFEQVMAQMNIADQQSFARQYDTYWQQASEHSELLSVLICEVDFFQDYYDNYGYQATSIMLLVVGLALKQISEKQGGYLARYRDNGFAILIKGGDVQSIKSTAEALRAAVESAHSEHKHSSVSNVVTLSVGTSSIYPMSKQALMKESESALASAISAGRNQVYTNHDLEPQTEVQAASPSVTKPNKSNDPKKTEFENLMSEMQIFDRSDFNKHIVKTWKEASDEQELLSLVICELDFFAEYAANHKQRTCDDILLVVACALKSSCEPFDGFIARLEGAKFVALIKGGNATKGLKLAEALHKSIQELEMEHTHSPVKNSLTLSLGLSNIFPSDENSMKTLLVNSSKALKDAKSRGYDQIGVC